jgi:cyanophycinase
MISFHQTSTMTSIFNSLMLYFMVAASSGAYAQQPVHIDTAAITRHGPEHGALLIIGGNVGNTATVWDKFVSLAGGREKTRIVVVTAAIGDSAAYDQKDINEIKKLTGIKHVTLLHTSSLSEANSERFIKPIREATGVYFMGGRQWRIADAYLNTLTHQAFFDVLKRGGVIAGSSAGATIQGSFLWRGDTSGADVLVGDHLQGLGFLKNSAIDQHLLKRNRQFDLVDFIRFSPKLIGIGLDEATAIVVQKDTLEVIGKSYVAIYDHDTIIKNIPFVLLQNGQSYDLKNRKIIAPQRVPGSVGRNK